MKLSLPYLVCHVVLACVVTLVVAAPRPDRDAKTLKNERSDDSGDGNFYYSFETSNGISEDREGGTGREGQTNMLGSYSFPLPDGTVAEFTYLADEGGNRVKSPLLPTPHPLPAHAIQQIAFAERQRARESDYVK